jgi:hypothetical protein
MASKMRFSCIFPYYSPINRASLGSQFFRTGFFGATLSFFFFSSSSSQKFCRKRVKSRGTKKCAPLLLLLLLVVFLLANVDARAEDDFYALRDSYDGTSPDILAFFFPRGVW